MTRVLMWNIQFFTDQNFSDASRSSTLSAQHIVDAIKECEPAIVVVIEVRTGPALGVGSMLTATGGQAGVLTLRERLGDHWWVVPPQVLNVGTGGPSYCEGIAVFFDDRAVDFIGPCIWTDAGSKPRDLAHPPMAGTDYPAPWTETLPNVAPAAIGFNGFTQRQFAGQTFFHDSANKSLEFPVGSWSRRPFYTAFWDKIGNRVIKIASVHLPPQTTWAKQAARELGKVADIEAAIQTDGATKDTKGEILLLGDFNLNAMLAGHRAALESGNLDYYRMLVDGGSTQATLIRSLPSANKPTKDPRLFKQWRKYDPTNEVLTAFDNILYRTYPAVPTPPVPALWIGDWVWENKPDRPAFPNAYMARTLQSITSSGSDGDKENVFLSPANYSKMRTASDHLLLTVDV